VPMTNHVHFLVSAAEVPSISMFMKGISQKYAQYLNRRFERKGTWWRADSGRARSQSSSTS